MDGWFARLLARWKEPEPTPYVVDESKVYEGLDVAVAQSPGNDEADIEEQKFALRILLQDLPEVERQEHLARAKVYLKFFHPSVD